MKWVSAWAWGLLFGIGLCVSGMTNPDKVLAFLDLAGAWDPALMFVLGGAVVTSTLGYRWVLQRQRPVLESEMCVPAARAIDARLIGGSLVFGIGWGLYGYCPGPAIAALAYLQTETVWFVLALIAGSLLARRFAAPAVR